MSGPALVLTPFSWASRAIELGNRQWRKKVLPVGDVEYQGRTLHFTPDYLRNLESAFRDRAYDAVSFQLADARNSHTNDPERHRGMITDMRAEQDGLYITVSPTEAGEQVLRDNPYLGVSARIVENYDRSDGKFYRAAMQHVLGTLDPRIPELGAWQPVDMSNSGTWVIDLSASTWAGEQLPGDDELTDQEISDLIDAMSDEELAGLEAEYMATLPPGSGYGDSEFDAAFTQQAAQQAAQQQARAEADMADLISPARSSEDKMARAISRLQDGIYTAPAPASFAQTSAAAIELAADRTMITGMFPCGQLDDFGRCSARFHALTCDHGVSSSDTSAEVAAAGAYGRALGAFGAASLANSAPDGAVMRDFGDPYGESAYQIPAATVELARQLNDGWGLHGDAGPPSWDDLLSAPSGPADPYSSLATEVGRPDLASPQPPSGGGYPGIRELARDLGLR